MAFPVLIFVALNKTNFGSLNETVFVLCSFIQHSIPSSNNNVALIMLYDKSHISANNLSQN